MSRHLCSLKGFVITILILFGCCGLVAIPQSLNAIPSENTNTPQVGGLLSEEYVYDEDVGSFPTISVWVGGYLNVYQGRLTRWDYGFGPAGWYWREVYPTDIYGNPIYNVPYAYAQGKGFVLEGTSYYEDIVYAKIP